MLAYIPSLLIAYLLGSIPFGLILTKLAGMGDIRTIGSGNIGATNVLRTGNKKIAALTLLLDGIKGLVAVLIARYCFAGTESLAALVAVLGHMYPVWLKFKGGKGVVTAGGVAMGLAWPIGLTMFLTWLAVLKISRTSSLAGMITTGLLPLFAVIYGHAAYAPMLTVIAAWVIYRHSENIKRLLAGTEPKIGSKS